MYSLNLAWFGEPDLFIPALRFELRNVVAAVQGSRCEEIHSKTPHVEGKEEGDDPLCDDADSPCALVHRRAGNNHQDDFGEYEE